MPLLDYGYELAILTDRSVGLKNIYEFPLYKKTISKTELSLLNYFTHKFTRVLELYKTYKSIKLFNPNLIHFHYANNRLGILLSFLINRRIIVSVMGGDVLFNVKYFNPIDKFLIIRLLNKSSHITVKSFYLGEKVGEIVKDKSKISKLLWGVDTKNFRPSKNIASDKHKIGVCPDLKIIFCPKAIHPIYNTKMIIDALSIVRTHYKKVLLLLTDFNSDEEYKIDIYSRIEEYKLYNNVKVLKKLNHSEIPIYYRASDIIIGIPNYDGLPQSLLEAMASGKPHILGKLAQYDEIVENNVDAILSELSAEKIANSMLTLLSNSNLCIEIGERARNKILSIADVKDNISKIDNIYKKYIN